ncbi:acyl-CoA dehydrogenase [Microbacterium sp. Root61]|uniref:acyl-CoA dehydrogenase family protein n=1 Tax=Microbacterium sp. Root61 TaxID=1736570 RepID=UPI0006F9DF2D|nr:acyl-CoA dehydrogenase family protein [Microbacterium sp. Root61]KRA24534.1 acyl-CoA dehydrogenase [Microbacterium sp. Root61]
MSNPDVSSLAEDRLSGVFSLDALLPADAQEWQQRAREFARTRIAPVIEEDFENQYFRRELVEEFGAAGFLGMHISGYGCAGASATAYGAVCLELEAVDSGWRTFVSVQGSLAMSAIAKFGSEPQKERWLPEMAAGRVIGCFALTEPTGGSDPAAMTTTARRDGDGWVISGTKRWIGLATLADIAIVWANTDEGIRGFIVPTDSDGFEATAITGKLAMRASIQCDVSLDEVRVGDDALLPGVTGLRGPFSCLNEARYGIVWGVMGAARSCLEVAIARSQDRSVFGAPIGSFQLTQAKLADMLLEYEKGVLLALHLGAQKDAGTLTHAQISVGKLNNVREAIAIAGAARSVLGGDGITSEFPVMRHMANLEAVRTYEGTDEIHALILGRELTGFAAFS